MKKVKLKVASDSYSRADEDQLGLKVNIFPINT